MMRKYLAAAAAICMCSGVAYADTLTLEEQAFVRLAIRTVKVVQECQGYELVPGAVVRDGASKGVDVQRIGGAIEQAVLLNQHMEYDGSKAIPEVTKLVSETTNTLIKDQQYDKVEFCKRYTSFYLIHGLIQPKRRSELSLEHQPNIAHGRASSPLGLPALSTVQEIRRATPEMASSMTAPGS
jgi:hypothetical protein